MTSGNIINDVSMENIIDSDVDYIKFIDREFKR